MKEISDIMKEVWEVDEKLFLMRQQVRDIYGELSKRLHEQFVKTTTEKIKMRKKEYISTNEARRMVKEKFMSEKRISLPTLITWVKEYKLGYKFVGRWMIDKEKFTRFLIKKARGY